MIIKLGVIGPSYEGLFYCFMNMSKQLLHVGCGALRIDATPFAKLNYEELRVDLDPTVQPDLIGSITDLSSVPDASCDAIYSSHNLEHLYAYEVPKALGEFFRVLRSDGLLLITCPDLQSIAEQIAADKLTDPAYMSDAGPITPLDMVFGLRSELQRGNHYMAHKCGFTASVLAGSLQEAGFAQIACRRRGANLFDLWALATKTKWADQQLRDTVQLLFPA